METNVFTSNDTKTYFFKNGGSKIFVIESLNNNDIDDFCNKNREYFSKILLKFGGILFRNFSIRSISEFNKLAHFFLAELFEYVYRSTPRTRLGGKIYTATEYPADRYIPLHNEFSYFKRWPDKIIFFCVTPPKQGGETLIADSRCVYKNIDESIIKIFNKKHVMYVRNYTSGIDLNWREVFQTKEKKHVEEFCDSNGIDYIWHDHNKNGLELTTKQVCQATIQHPKTHDNIWFNQAHLFHYTTLPKNIANALISNLGEKNLTRNSFYGDNTSLNTKSLQEIRQSYEKEIIRFEWKRGDVMLLDNILMAHGRASFSGERKIAVAMGKSSIYD